MELHRIVWLGLGKKTIQLGLGELYFVGLTCTAVNGERQIHY